MNRNVRMLLIAVGIAAAMLRATGGWAAPDDTERAANAAAQQQAVVIDPSNFDQWVFQGSGNAVSARAQIDARYRLQLELLTRAYDLSDAQKAKLRLAASGDTQRFFDEVEVVRQKFLESQKDQNALGNIWQEIQPLQLKMAGGLFGEQSLYARILPKTLEGDQAAKHQAVLAERKQFRYRAAVEGAIAMLDDAVALEDKQRLALIQMLIDKTKPPATFGQFDYYFVWYRLSTLPEKDIKPLFNERQWRLLKKQLDQGREMRVTLVQNGAIGADDGR
ncbi:MAG: hypothetical protein WD845_04970 [Pirellulales bacterium]